METKEYQIKFQGWHKVYLTGNRLTGDTFEIRNWIKNRLNGTWNAQLKCWIVDVELVKKWNGDGSTNTLIVK